MPAAERKHTITADRTTWLKREPVAASKLPPSKKQIVAKGDEYGIKSFSQTGGGHWALDIEGLLGKWYIFDVAENHVLESHWDCSWERDDANEDDRAAENFKQLPPKKEKPKPVGYKLTKDMPFSTLITPHISYGEIALWEEQRRFVQNYQVKPCVQLCEFLEDVRAAFGDKPIRITSGYRPPAVNRSVGGAIWSEHLYRAPRLGAVDFQIIGADIWAVQRYCIQHWNHSVGKGAAKGFVHLGIGRGRIVWPY